MQVFTPYANKRKTAKCLDNKRLVKQILESIQIICALTDIDIGWKIPVYIKNHQNTKRWKGHLNLSYLFSYLNILIIEAAMRGIKTDNFFSIHRMLICGLSNVTYDKIVCYNAESAISAKTCKEHQELLLSKKEDHYRRYF